MERCSRQLATVACIFLTIMPALSQTKWFKYEGNPVLNVGAPGTWESVAVMPDRVIKDGPVYKLWYTGISSNRHRIGYATSPDGVHWTKYGSNPVLNLGPTSWDANNSGHGFVILSGSIYHMWYFGTDPGGKSRMGYASSTDGIAWTKASGSNPIIDVGAPGAWDDQGIAIASVVGPDTGGGYMMWFHGQHAGSTMLHIGYATATDSVTWTKYAGNPVVSPGPGGSWDQDFSGYPRILEEGGTFRMWYAGTNLFPQFRIGYAESDDGITWTKVGGSPVLQPGPAGSWDDYAVYGGDVILEGGVYRMWYRGNDGSTLRIGNAVSPKGFSVTVSTTDMVINSTDDTLLVTIRVADPANMKFAARFKPRPQFPGVPIDTLELFDDGAHGDTLAGDGIFANRWIPDSAIYDIDLTLSLYDTLNFELKNAVTDIVTHVESIASLLPEGFHLAQNYPNPFNPSTTIRFTVNGSLFTSLAIYNILGQKVATLVNEKLDPGTHSVTWDATGFPSGVFFYRLQAGEFVQTKKLVLLR